MTDFILLLNINLIKKIIIYGIVQNYIIEEYDADKKSLLYLFLTLFMCKKVM